MHVHGKTGLEGAPLHEPIKGLQKAHAVDFLVSTLREAPDRSITFCSTGPLTNLAALLIQTLEVKHGIKEVVIAGGAYLKRGNSDALHLSRRLKDRPLILLGRIISA